MSRLRIVRGLRMAGIVGMCLLSACGGKTISGSAPSTTPTPPTVDSTVKSVSLITSSPQIASDNTGPATITALVTDANNDTVTGATVTFSASSGVLAVSQGTTDAKGAAIATLAAGSDESNRTVTVTATVGTVTGKVTVNVIGTALSITGPQALVEPGVATYTVILKNAAATGISGQAVALTSANGNTLSAASVTTDVNGQATFTVTAAAGGTDTLTATALGITATETISVSTQNFAITTPVNGAAIDIGVVKPVTVVWTNAGAPVMGQTINFAATRGTLSAATAV